MQPIKIILNIKCPKLPKICVMPNVYIIVVSCEIQRTAFGVMDNRKIHLESLLLLFPMSKFLIMGRNCSTIISHLTVVQFP